MDAARSLTQVSGLISPQLLASERYLELSGSLAKIFPQGRIQRGSVILFEGGLNSGVTSATFEFLATELVQKSWCALVGFENIGFFAAFQKGVNLTKVVSVPDPGQDVAQVAAVLMEAFPIVVLANPRYISFSQVRNLTARIRQNSSIIVVVRQQSEQSYKRSKDVWYGSCDYVINSSSSDFFGLGHGDGFIEERQVSLSLGNKRIGETRKGITVAI